MACSLTRSSFSFMNLFSCSISDNSKSFSKFATFLVYFSSRAEIKMNETQCHDCLAKIPFFISIFSMVCSSFNCIKFLSCSKRELFTISKSCSNCFTLALHFSSILLWLWEYFSTRAICNCDSYYYKLIMPHNDQLPFFCSSRLSFSMLCFLTISISHSFLRINLLAVLVLYSDCKFSS